MTSENGYVILMAENREANPPGKEIQMFRLRFVLTVSEYERHDMLRSYYDSSDSLRSYEIGKTKWLDTSE